MKRCNCCKGSRPRKTEVQTVLINPRDAGSATGGYPMDEILDVEMELFLALVRLV
jgi:hypothetical protein